MTEPLSIQVARKYGYGTEGSSRSASFREWIDNYVESLNLDSLNFKPIEVLSYDTFKVRELTKEILEYIFDYDKYNFSNAILNPNFIYKLNGSVSGTLAVASGYYIPIEIPFDSLTSNARESNMKGIYIYPNGGHTYTTSGFNLDSDGRSIIGIASFSLPMNFMNWQKNPLNPKPTNQHPSSLKEQYDETVNWLKENFKGD